VGLARRVAALDQWSAGTVKLPVARTFQRLGLQATHLNVLGLAGCCCAAVLLVQHRYVIGGAIFLVASALDAFDGTLARLRGKDGIALGPWLDTFFDSVGEGVVGLALVLSLDDPTLSKLAAGSMLASLLVGHAKAVAGESRIDPDWGEVRLLGRGLRVLILALGMITAGAVGAGAAAGSGSGGVIAATLLCLLAFNVSVLTYRIVKIVNRANQLDRDRPPTEGADTMASSTSTPRTTSLS
jgi:phosphatidylglycerophosphate synthase